MRRRGRRLTSVFSTRGAVFKFFGYSLVRVVANGRFVVVSPLREESRRSRGGEQAVAEQFFDAYPDADGVFVSGYTMSKIFLGLAKKKGIRIKRLMMIQELLK